MSCLSLTLRRRLWSGHVDVGSADRQKDFLEKRLQVLDALPRLCFVLFLFHVYLAQFDRHLLFSAAAGRHEAPRLAQMYRMCKCCKKGAKVKQRPPKRTDIQELKSFAVINSNSFWTRPGTRSRICTVAYATRAQKLHAHADTALCIA
jgi:hypothetical protein